MNWGWGPNYQGGYYFGRDYRNGWFYTDFVNVTNDRNYAKDRKMMLVYPQK